MTPEAMKRTLDRHIAYRKRAGEIGKKLRWLGAKTDEAGFAVELFRLADELDPPDVVLASETNQ